MGKKLNIGAGRTRIPGFVNIDVSSRAEVTLDLGRDPLPFPDDSVELVFSYHTLEHVEDYLFALAEIHRVLKHGGLLLLGLPYVTLTEYNLVNPYHRHNFNEHSFRFFDRAGLKGSAVEENPILFDPMFHRFHYIGGFHLVPPPLRGWCRRHLFNVVRKIDFGLVCVKRTSTPLPEVSPSELRREFRRCLASRVPYDAEVRAPRGRLHSALKGCRLWWQGKGP